MCCDDHADGIDLPKFRRLVVPDYPHHVTQRGVRKQRTFFEDADYLGYIDLATELLPSHDLSILAYCLMPNHIHMVIVPRDAHCLSKFLATLHRRYARNTNKKYDWQGHLWQQRFYSVVMDSGHTVAAMRYVELNPVRAGLVDDAARWRWSSARGNLGLAHDPLVDEEALATIVQDWKSVLADDSLGEGQDELRKRTRTGRPSGEIDFIRRIETLSGRTVLRASQRHD